MLIGMGLLIVAVAGLTVLPGSPWPNAVDRQPARRPAQTTADPSFGEPGVTSATPTPSPLDVTAGEVSIDVDGWWSWAMLDQRTGEIYGSDNMTETSTTASLIKAWIAADFLRGSTEQGRTPSEARMRQLEIMIRDSDNTAAQRVWEAIGQSEAIARMIEICRLTDSSAVQNRWSNTQLSPRDVARLGACIADGRAAGSEWTDWLLDQMRAVRGTGDFGVRKAFPEATAATIAIKNGWVIRDADREWHVNCLAVGDGWTMGVMTQFSTSRPYTYGAQICEDVARQLRTVAPTPTGF